MSKKNLLCFDIDGVLLNEKHWFSERWKHAFSMFNFSNQVLKDFWIIFNKKGYYYKNHIDELGVKHPEILDFKNKLIVAFKETVIEEKKIENVEILLEQCSSNNYLSIISNGVFDIQYDRLLRSGLIGFFDLIICDKVNKKPSAVPYKMTKFYYNVDNCFYVGNEYDSDFIGAKSENFTTIYYNVKNQKFSKSLVDYSINNILDIKKIIS